MSGSACGTLLLFVLGACKGKDDVDDTGPVSPDDTSSPTDDTAPPTDDTSTPPKKSDYGLDVRPANKTCLAPDRPLLDFEAEWERAWPKLSFSGAVQLLHPPGDDSVMYVVQQSGEVFAFDNDPGVSEVELVLDLSAVVYTSYESGLLGIAFHPDFASNGRVFLSYNTYSGGPWTQLTEVSSKGIGELIEMTGERTILELPQPANNHNGGEVAFGPDGYLYFSLGDGGGADDTHDNGQDPFTLLGTILRIDVDGAKPYAIPADNPYADGKLGAPEVWAWGLRNPWRFFFDPVTGELWTGDVGQGNWEEVDLIEGGGNYGWPNYEGFACYLGPCDDEGFLDPVVDYDPGGSASVVMGPVYRGDALSGLEGAPLFTDFFDGELRGVFWDEASGDAYIGSVVPDVGYAFSAFGLDADQEVYGLDYYGGGIHKLVPTGKKKKKKVEFPALLSQTGCVDPSDPTQPAEGLIPYTPGAPFWSDGADKDRWLAIPDGEAITIDDDGDFELPEGSVLMKQFERAGTVFETRLLVRHDDGGWAGYTYAWNDDGTDADWVVAGKTTEVEGLPWTYPTASQCLECHTEAAGRSLGLELAQLNSDQLYTETNRLSNQLLTLDHIGLIDLKGKDPAKAPALEDPYGSASTEVRARAYLHTNCAMCHQPGAAGGGGMDLRWSTGLADMAVCDVEPETGDLGITDARIVAPGEPDRSLLVVRTDRRDAYGMPPLASHLVDDAGVALLREWVEELAGCP